MIRVHNRESVNTGALAAVRRKGNTLHFSTVEASAQSNCVPYPMAGEAPRIYGDFSSRDIKSTWLRWVADLLNPNPDYPLYFETDQEVRLYIERNINRIPELSWQG